MSGYSRMTGTGCGHPHSGFTDKIVTALEAVRCRVQPRDTAAATPHPLYGTVVIAARASGYGMVESGGAGNGILLLCNHCKEDEHFLENRSAGSSA